MKNRGKYVGILLAGGQSRRFGSPKAFAVHQNEYFFKKVIKVLEPYVNDIIIVSHPSITQRLQSEYEGKVIEDVEEFRGDGPLAGIYSGMSTLTSDTYIILPCDMPFLLPSTIMWLIEQYELSGGYDGVAPIVNGKTQPLVTILSQSVQSIIYKKLIKKQLRLMDLYNSTRINIVDATNLPYATDQFRNINSMDDYGSE
jgi:molybdopterin-guanine dinucleotide biosynthesis protein A